jgi:uncharacterized membrane protein
MILIIWLSLFAALVLLVLLPFVFVEVMSVGLLKLHLSANAALLLILAVIVGSFVNIPVKRIQQSTTAVYHPLAIFGFPDLWPELQRVCSETVVAVNVGGCLIPLGLAVYEMVNLVLVDAWLLGAAVIASALDIAACYFLARPVPKVGIALPSLVPALLAVAAALLLAHEQAPPVAFIAGVTGPLVGADILHLRDVARIGTGVASIGGAGTFDGIILSGILAAYLA